MDGCAIGISAALEQVRWEAWEQTVAMAPRSYAASVQATGAIALILPPDPAADASPDPFLDRVDGLLLSGGADIDPAAYGAARHPETKVTWPDRDRFEIALARRALDREMPVLGVCRGMQLLNVALGGTLIQHLPDTLGHQDHRRTPGIFGEHVVRLEPGSLAAGAAGAERVVVKSHHHQGVDWLGDGLVASGWSHDEELVEAVELPEHRFVLGVLWHPEEDPGSPLIDALVEAARAKVAG